MVDRVIAQHYGAPTQLLDWTLDPFVAVYFAVSDPTGGGLDAAFYYASPLSGISSRSPVTFPFTRKLTRLIPPVLDERVRTQKSVFTIQNFGTGEAFLPLDDRQLKVSQAGEGTDPSDEVAEFGKIIIPQDRKRQILLQLLNMGIDASLMFPGLQGIGQRIAMHADLKNYGGDGLF